MRNIQASRVHRVIGAPERTNSWEGFKRRTAIETVTRDPRPARAVVGYIMTALAAGVGLTMGGMLAMEIATKFIQLSVALHRVF